jgi:hypothetical protein
MVSREPRGDTYYECEWQSIDGEGYGIDEMELMRWRW